LEALNAALRAASAPAAQERESGFFGVLLICRTRGGRSREQDLFEQIPQLRRYCEGETKIRDAYNMLLCLRARIADLDGKGNAHNAPPKLSCRHRIEKDHGRLDDASNANSVFRLFDHE
jgi:hypothetical protein